MCPQNLASKPDAKAEVQRVQPTRLTFEKSNNISLYKRASHRARTVSGRGAFGESEINGLTGASAKSAHGPPAILVENPFGKNHWIFLVRR
ncbi:hypothetical protein [Rhizobium sp. Root1204]|uniref:hypothetical protein n=1 Tax=Rhizobium sp. Root1204 TaxID=1736428 RepID=UPI000AB45E4E|nr:hypothetical protein [Rhizobium sp. Root1204]